MGEFLGDFIVVFGLLSLLFGISFVYKRAKENKIKEQLTTGERTILSFETAQRKLTRFKRLSKVNFIFTFVIPTLFFIFVSTIVSLGYIVELAIGLGIYILCMFSVGFLFYVSRRRLVSLEKNPVVFVRCDTCGYDSKFAVMRPVDTTQKSLPYRMFLFLLSINRENRSNMFINKHWYIACNKCGLREV
jgi:hypothetical protein